MLFLDIAFHSVSSQLFIYLLISIVIFSLNNSVNSEERKIAHDNIVPFSIFSFCLSVVYMLDASHKCVTKELHEIVLFFYNQSLKEKSYAVYVMWRQNITYIYNNLYWIRKLLVQYCHQPQNVMKG